MCGWREDKSSPQAGSSHNGAWNQVGVLKLLLQYLHVYIALISHTAMSALLAIDVFLRHVAPL